MIDHVVKSSGTWKIHPKVKINFMELKDRGEKRLMHSSIDNRETMIGNDTDKIMERISEYFFNSY